MSIFFSCVSWSFVFHPLKNACSCSLPIFKTGLLISLRLNFLSFLYMLWNNPLPDDQFANISLCSVVASSLCFLHWTEALWLDIIPFVYFCFTCLCYLGLSQENLAYGNIFSVPLYFPLLI